MQTMQATDSTVFTDETFWKAFMHDLEQTRARVLIQSPFLSARRIRLMSRVLTRLINSGVTVCAIVQQPRHWGEVQNVSDPVLLHLHKEMQSNLELLEGMGVHVTLRTDIHEKLAVIDSSVFWEGSLNILSHGNTRERMRRWTNKQEIRQAIVQHCLAECAVCMENFLHFGVAEAAQRNSLGATLAQHRRILALSQREVARRSGVSQGRIAHIEAGASNITLETYTRIADALDLVPVLVPRLLIASVARLLQKFGPPA